MADLKSLAFLVNEILSQYIIIHDNIFEFSLRKWIPIPVIFKAIDFCSHETELVGLCAKLSELQHKVDTMKALSNVSQSEQAFLVGLNEYTIALSDTIVQLHLIAKRCCQKSERILKYSFREYWNDVHDYKISVKRYTLLGNRLNLLFRVL